MVILEQFKLLNLKGKKKNEKVIMPWWSRRDQNEENMKKRHVLQIRKKRIFFTALHFKDDL